QLGSARRRGELRQTTNCQQRAGAAHESCGFHGFLLLDAPAVSIPASSPPAAERNRRRSARALDKGSPCAKQARRMTAACDSTLRSSPRKRGPSVCCPRPPLSRGRPSTTVGFPLARE